MQKPYDGLVFHNIFGSETSFGFPATNEPPSPSFTCPWGRHTAMSKTGYRVSFVDAVDVDGDLPSTSTSTRARPKFQKSQTTPVLQEPSEVAWKFLREALVD